MKKIIIAAAIVASTAGVAEARENFRDSGFSAARGQAVVFQNGTLVGSPIEFDNDRTLDEQYGRNTFVFNAGTAHLGVTGTTVSSTQFFDGGFVQTLRRGDITAQITVYDNQ